MEIFAKIDFGGLKCPHEVLVGLKTCSAICGTHVQTILNHKDLTGSAVGVGKVKIRCNMGQMGAILGHILTLPHPHCQPGQIFVVQNGLYMCLAYSTICFKFNQLLRGVF